jgi:hypothetical protein
MKLSELIEELIVGRIEGEPENNGWQSISHVAGRRESYHQRMQELREAIDAYQITEKGQL